MYQHEYINWNGKSKNSIFLYVLSKIRDFYFTKEL